MISSISLKNFKCFDDVTFGLKRLSILAGLNGMGKSTVLQALLLLRQSFIDRSLESTGLSLNGSIIELGTAKDIFNHEAAIDDNISFVLKLDEENIFTWSFKYDAEADVLQYENGAEVITNASEFALFSDKFSYLSAERIGPRRTYEMSDYQVRHHSQLGSQGQYTPHFLHLFGKQQVRKQLRHPDAKSDDLNAQVESWLREFRPDIRFSIDAHESIDQMELTYSFTSGEVTSHPIRSINTGFGLTYVLPVLTALLASKGGGLIVLENPEAHIHPKGQSIIGELIARAASSGAQVIVETHSDHILNGIRIAVLKGILDHDDVNIHFLSAEGDAVVIHNPTIDHNGRIDNWPSGFFDEWEKSIEEFLKSPPK